MTILRLSLEADACTVDSSAIFPTAEIKSASASSSVNPYAHYQSKVKESYKVMKEKKKAKDSA